MLVNLHGSAEKRAHDLFLGFDAENARAVVFAIVSQWSSNESFVSKMNSPNLVELPSFE